MKAAYIAGRNVEANCEGGSSDQQIVGADVYAPGCEVRPDARMNSGDYEIVAVFSGLL